MGQSIQSMRWRPITEPRIRSTTVCPDHIWKTNSARWCATLASSGRVRPLLSSHTAGVNGEYFNERESHSTRYFSIALHGRKPEIPLSKSR